MPVFTELLSPLMSAGTTFRSVSLLFPPFFLSSSVFPGARCSCGVSASRCSGGWMGQKALDSVWEGMCQVRVQHARSEWACVVSIVQM